jgi:hypothetical protein
LPCCPFMKLLIYKLRSYNASGRRRRFDRHLVDDLVGAPVTSVAFETIDFTSSSERTGPFRVTVPFD